MTKTGFLRRNLASQGLKIRILWEFCQIEGVFGEVLDEKPRKAGGSEGERATKAGRPLHGLVPCGASLAAWGEKEKMK